MPGEASDYATVKKTIKSEKCLEWKKMLIEKESARYKGLWFPKYSIVKKIYSIKYVV